MSFALVEDFDKDGNSDVIVHAFGEASTALFGGDAGLAGSPMASAVPFFGYPGTGRISVAEREGLLSLLVANQCGDCAGVFANFTIVEQPSPQTFEPAGQSSPVFDWRGNDVIAHQLPDGSTVAVSLTPEGVLHPGGRVGRTFFGVSEIASDSVAQVGVAEDVALSFVAAWTVDTGPLLVLNRSGPDPAVLLVSVVRNDS